MAEVAITMIKKQYLTEKLNLTDEEIEGLRDGDNPYYDDLDMIPQDMQDCDYDYEVVNVDTGDIIVAMDD